MRPSFARRLRRALLLIAARRSRGRYYFFLSGAWVSTEPAWVWTAFLVTDPGFWSAFDAMLATAFDVLSPFLLPPLELDSCVASSVQKPQC